jgi:hypothetical protein
MDRVGHGYDDLDPDIAWKVAAEGVEPMIAGPERALAQRPPE